MGTSLQLLERLSQNRVRLPRNTGTKQFALMLVELFFENADRPKA